VGEPPGDSGKDGPAAAPPGPAAHAPFLLRLRRTGRDPAPFSRGRSRLWVAGGLTLLVLLAALPFAAPATAPAAERVTTMLALLFLLAAPGLWMGMGSRAFAVAGALVLLLYAATFWAGLSTPLRDVFVVALVSAFLIFGLAGFNLVFVLEEAVYDLHRLMHLRRRVWKAVPVAVVLALAAGLPFLDGPSGLELKAVWVAAVAGSALLLGWHFVALVNRLRPSQVLPELHLLVVAGLAAAFLLDATALLRLGSSLAPSAVAYAAIVGTWLYVSYSTLQRTHFLLAGRNAMPWLSILLAASFAIVSHTQRLVTASGSEAVGEIAVVRVGYLVAGVATGIVFLVLRSGWRILRLITTERELSERSRAIAGRAAQLTAGLLWSEKAIEETAFAVFRAMDQVLPGRHHPPQHKGWELDAESQSLRPLRPRE